jgi:tetratricopeptide (TPR) repeat protein
MESFQNSPADRQRTALQLAHIEGAIRGDESAALAIYDQTIANAKDDVRKAGKDAKALSDANLSLYLVIAEKGQFLFSLGAFGQAKETLADALQRGEKILAKHAGLAISVRIDDIKNIYAQTLMYMGGFSEAARELDALNQRASRNKDNALAMRVEDSLGILNRMRGKHDEALVYFSLFRDRAQKAGDKGRLSAALMRIANLYEALGMWNDAAADYQQAFSSALSAQDMNYALTAMQGIYNCDIRNDLGLVGKVDYRSAQGLPWKGALTARTLSTKRPKTDDGFNKAWGIVDSRRNDAPVPALDGFRMIREVSLRNAPEVHNYYQEVQLALAIGDAVLRRGEARVCTARKAEEALKELSARKDEAKEEKYVKTAFETAAKLLRSLAGRDILAAREESFEVQTGGFFVEASEPQTDEQFDTKNAIEADLTGLSRMMGVLALKDSEMESVQLALVNDRAIPDEIAARLRRALMPKSSGVSLSKEDKESALLRILESTHPSLKRAAGSLAESGGKLEGLAASKLKKQMEELKKEVSVLAPNANSYMLASINAGEEMRGYLRAWENTRRRVIVIKAMGLSVDVDRELSKFCQTSALLSARQRSLLTQRFQHR